MYLVTLKSLLSDIMEYVMELLSIVFRSQYWYWMKFIAAEPEKSTVDQCRPLTSTHSTARGDPTPFVFRQETGMQKGGEHTKRKGRKDMGVLWRCVCMYVCIQKELKQRQHERNTWILNIQTIMSRNEKTHKVYLLNRRQVEKKKGEKGQKNKSTKWDNKKCQASKAREQSKYEGGLSHPKGIRHWVC